MKWVTPWRLHVVEEVAGGEPAPRREGGAGVQRRREADEVRVAVVERRRGIRAVARAQVEDDAQRLPAHGEARVADDGRLRIAGGAGRVDVHHHVRHLDVGNVGLGGGRRVERFGERAERRAAQRLGRRRAAYAVNALQRAELVHALASRPRRPAARAAVEVCSTCASAAPRRLVLISAPMRAELGHRPFRHQEVGRVLHHDRHRVAAPRAGAADEVGVAVDALVVGAIADRLCLEAQQHAVGDAAPPARASRSRRCGSRRRRPASARRRCA